MSVVLARKALERMKGRFQAMAARQERDLHQAAAKEQTRAEKSEQFSRANLKTLVAAGIPIATGTDAGNPLTLHGPAIYAEMDAMQSAGMTPMQVIVSSTAIAAKAMGIDAVTGTTVWQSGGVAAEAVTRA